MVSQIVDAVPPLRCTVDWVICPTDRVPHGFCWMVLVYQVWFLEVLAVSAVLLCLLKCRLMASPFRTLASNREQLLPVGRGCLVDPPDRPRQSFSETSSPCLPVYAHCTHGQVSGFGTRASSLTRFADHKAFDHPLSQSTNEFLSTITILSRLAPQFQKSGRRPRRTLLGPPHRRRETACAYPLAENHVAVHQV